MLDAEFDEIAHGLFIADIGFDGDRVAAAFLDLRDGLDDIGCVVDGHDGRTSARRKQAGCATDATRRACDYDSFSDEFTHYTLTLPRLQWRAYC